jgi:hypothetical protein
MDLFTVEHHWHGEFNGHTDSVLLGVHTTHDAAWRVSVASEPVNAEVMEGAAP